MELNITELDRVNTLNPYNIDNNPPNDINYWQDIQTSDEQSHKEKRKKVSFTDILSNMNLVVNSKGVLQFITPKRVEQQSHNIEQYNQTQYYPEPVQEYQQQYTHQIPQEPVDPSVKHSYIYNKYFKDYTDIYSEKPIIRVPKTMEEYRQMLLEDRIKAIENKKRIEEIKSRKLLFTTTPNSGYSYSNSSSNSNPRNIIATKNNLRMMNFR